MLRPPRTLLILLVIAFVLRMAPALSTDPIAKYTANGGDERWYLAYGLSLLIGIDFTEVHGLMTAPSQVPTAPLYLVFVGTMQAIFPPAEAIIAIWVVQSALGAILALFAYDLARRLTGRAAAGWFAALMVAFSPALVLEPQYIATETLYIFFLAAGIWGYARYLAVPERGSMGGAVGVGLVLGYATLTRGASILFPVGLAGLLLFAYPATERGRALRYAVLLLLIYILTISTWTLYNAIHYGRFVIVTNQYTAVFWRGAVEGDSSPQENDRILGDQTPGEQAAEIIQEDPVGFVQRRLTEWTDAHLQPHGTVPLGGESLRELAQGWVNSGFSAEGFSALVRGEGFVPKLLIYIWHFGGFILGAAGVWLTRREWRVSLALVGFILYTSMLHLVVLALPRYIFPTHIFYLIFAGCAAAGLWQILRQR